MSATERPDTPPSLRPPAGGAERHAALLHLFALRAHERYLTALLARYDGPLHPIWAAELARVRAMLAER